MKQTNNSVRATDMYQVQLKYMASYDKCNVTHKNIYSSTSHCVHVSVIIKGSTTIVGLWDSKPRGKTLVS